MLENSSEIRPVSPFTNHLGIGFVEVKDGASRCEPEIRDIHSNRSGSVHGGVLFSMVDTSMGAAVHSLLKPGERCATIEIKISYFEPVLEGQVNCHAKVIKRGSRIAFIESEAYLGDRIVAKGTGAFAISSGR